MAIHSLTGPTPSGTIGTVSKIYDDALASGVTLMLIEKYNWTPTIPDPNHPSGQIPNKEVGMLFIEDAEIYWTAQLRAWAIKKDQEAAAAILHTNQNMVESSIRTI